MNQQKKTRNHSTLAGLSWLRNAFIISGVCGFIFLILQTKKTSEIFEVPEVPNSLNTTLHILVTGGQGTLGKRLVHRLLEQGHVVNTIDVEPVARHNFSGPFRAIQGDFRDLSTLRQTLYDERTGQCVNGVVHLAQIGDAGTCAAQKNLCEDVNVRGVQKLIDTIKNECHESTKPWLIFLSSLDVEYLQKDTHLSAHFKYGTVLAQTKKDAESLLRNSGLAVVSMRFGMIYGDSATNYIADTSVNWLVKQAMIHQPIPLYASDQRTLVPNILHITDAVEALSLGVQFIPVLSRSLKIWNVGSTSLPTRYELIQWVLNVTGSMSPLLHLDSSENFHEVPEIAMHPHFLPRISWKDGVRMCSTTLRNSAALYLSSQLKSQCEDEEDEKISLWLSAIMNCSGVFVASVLDQEFVFQIYKPEAPYPGIGLPFENTIGQPFKNAYTSITLEPLANEIDYLTQFHATRIKPVRLLFTDVNPPLYLGFVTTNTTTKHKGSITKYLLRLTPSITADESISTVFFLVKDKATRKLSLLLQPSHVVPSSESPGWMYIKPLSSAEDNYGLGILPWDNIEYPLWFTPPLNGPFGHQQCPHLYSYDVLTDAFRNHENSGFEILNSTITQIDGLKDVSSYPILRCKKFAAAYNKLHIDSTVLSSGSFPTRLVASTTSQVTNEVISASEPAKIHGKQPHHKVSYHNWALAKLPACDNDCSYPLGCIDTGACRCVHPTCSTWSLNNYPTLADDSSASAQEYSLKPTEIAIKQAQENLIKAVKETPLTSLLLPSAIELWRNRHQLWPRIRSLQLNEDLVPLKSSSACTSFSPKQSFSADYQLLQGFLQGPTSVQDVDENVDFVAVPFYQGCYIGWIDWIGQFNVESHARLVWNHFHELTKPATTPDGGGAIWVMTHDWGGCVAFKIRVAEFHGQDVQPIGISGAVVVQNMGDWDTRCFIPHKDVVVPPRTPSSNALVKTFTFDMTQSVNQPIGVLPVKYRRIFATFSGTIDGTGTFIRLRLALPDLFPTQRHRVVITKKLLPDYIDILQQSQFCMIPAGIVGWTFRLSDAVYSGCIPVIHANRTLFPFFDLLDYTQFAVFIPETEILNIEHVLLSYSQERLQQMQINALRVRGIFVYASTPAEEVSRLSSRNEDEPLDISPLEMTLTNLAMRRMTEFPEAN